MARSSNLGLNEISPWSVTATQSNNR